MAGPKAPDVPQSLLRTTEAAQILKISRRTLQRLIKRGELPVIRIGGQIRIDPADLDRFIRVSRSG